MDHGRGSGGDCGAKNRRASLPSSVGYRRWRGQNRRPDYFRVQHRRSRVGQVPQGLSLDRLVESHCRYKEETMSTQQITDDTRIESTRIGPDDPRYLAVVDKRFNKRFRASPEYVRLVSSTDQVVSAVQDAVREGRRLVVTSGGHCLEGFVSNPEVRVIIDVSPMKRVYYDAELCAI